MDIHMHVQYTFIMNLSTNVEQLFSNKENSLVIEENSNIFFIKFSRKINNNSWRNCG